MDQKKELEQIVAGTQNGYDNRTNQPERRGFFYGLSDVFGKTLEFYTLLIPSRKLKEGLSKRLEHYDIEEMDKLSKEHFLDVQFVKEGYNSGGLLKAYERFWGSWNKLIQRPSRAVYDALGGAEHPFKATMGAFTFSGAVIHGLSPILIPSYTMKIISGNEENVLTTWAAVSATFVLFGIPVAISKLKRKRNLNR